MKIILTPVEIVCQRHGELFRARWNSGFDEFTDLAFEALLEEKDFAEEFGKTKINNNEDGENKAMHQLLHEKPMCCRIQPKVLKDVLLEVNSKTNTWDTKRCDLCSARRPGAKFRKVPPAGKTYTAAKPWDHVCIECVCK